jgi:NitT/TauT family transport system permease protein
MNTGAAWQRWAPFLTAIVALVAWQGIVTALGVAPFLFPSPVRVLESTWGAHDLLWRASASTLAESLVGFGSSALLGVFAAFILTRAAWIERSLVPYAVFLQTVPVVAIAPLLVLWFGIGFKAVAASSFLVAVFPVITATSAGLRSVDPELRSLFRLYRATRLQTLLRLELPSAVPFVVAGLRASSGLAVIGAVVGEFVAGHSPGAPGLGYVIMSSYRQVDTPLLFSAVLHCSALGLLLYGSVGLVGHRLLSRWHASSEA